MQFRVNPGDEIPIYRQIMRQVVEGIAGGHLKPGDQLPSHRDLASQLVIAPLTVKKAYDELERGGYIEMARGQGTFVSTGTPALSEGEKLELLRPLVRRAIHEARALGVPARQIQNLFSDESRALTEVRSQNAKQEKKP